MERRRDGARVGFVLGARVSSNPGVAAVAAPKQARSRSPL